MTTKKTLESLLQTLVNTPEHQKGAILYSLLKAIKETCKLFDNSKYKDYQIAAKSALEILEEILSEDSQMESAEFEEDDWEEEFAESASQSVESVDQEISKPQLVKTTSQKTESENSIIQLIKKWNSSTKNWMRLPEIDVNDHETAGQFVNSVTGLRSNILSNNFDNQSKYMSKLDQLWSDSAEILTKKNYSTCISSLTNVGQAQGKIIYTCRNRITKPEEELISPGLVYNGEPVHDPVWVISLPPDMDFPPTNENADMPTHWRGIFGEVEILIEQLKIQDLGFSAIEGLNKNQVEKLETCRESIINELERRTEVLRASILKNTESPYRIATDYWRVEECFWAVFHEDERPSGCSIFDRLRTRIQAWRTTLRRYLKLHIRDFACGSDTLASINKYIGNIIIKPTPQVATGIVTRELRPAIMVKVQGATRLLKGRVIAT